MAIILYTQVGFLLIVCDFIFILHCRIADDIALVINNQTAEYELNKHITVNTFTTKKNCYSHKRTLNIFYAVIIKIRDSSIIISAYPRHLGSLNRFSYFDCLQFILVSCSTSNWIYLLPKTIVYNASKQSCA